MALSIVKKEISLNVGQPNNFELICAMQGDSKSFEITATLYDVNKLYAVNTDNIKIKGENPAGLTILKDADSHTENTVTFTLTEDMLMYDGLLKLVLVFAESSTQLTTFPFVIKVINSPGSSAADDIKTVSALVEEARKWALLSKSYAVGTDNEARDGDKTDNSKYYYEQIQSLVNSGSIGGGGGTGNADILYYDTYEEFKVDLDAGKIPDETLICVKESGIYFSVKIISAENMSWDNTSGKEIQNNVEGAIVPVIYHADTGYYFPPEYSVAGKNGINIVRDSDRQITVSGMPSGDTEIALIPPDRQKTAQNPPTGLSDGGLKINGTTSAMEYASSPTASAWTGCKDGSTEITAGTWHVRFKETDSLQASDSVEVVIEAPENTKLLFYQQYTNSFYSDDMAEMNYIGSPRDITNDSYFMPFGRTSDYRIIYCNNMLFCTSYFDETGKWQFSYSKHDFMPKETSLNGLWENITLNDGNGGCADISYGNNHLIFAAPQGIYITDDEAIKRYRNSTINFSTAFTKMSGAEPTSITNVVFGNNTFILTGNRKSWYSNDYKTWKYIGEIKGALSYAAGENYIEKIVYGNGLFINFSYRQYDKYVFEILNSRNISAGWFNSNDAVLNNLGYTSSEDIATDLVFDESLNKFISPYYNATNNISGFYMYDGVNWSKTASNKLVKLYNCIFYKNKLYGFTYDNHWISIDNIDTYQYTDYGVVHGLYDSMHYFTKRGSYAVIETPLWDIDNTAD